MINPITFKANVAYNKEVEQNLQSDSPNPLRLKANLSSLTALSNYNQVLLIPQNDEDSSKIMQCAEALNNIAPGRIVLPHSYNTDEINGEYIYRDDGTLFCIREYSNETFTDYYPLKTGSTIERIEVRDKNSGEIIAKYSPQESKDGIIKTNITIFDAKINNKYTMFQAEEDGTISSITEFSGDGNSFKTLFRNPDTHIPVRYIDAKETSDGEFSLTDARFDKRGKVLEIRNIKGDKEVNINYIGNKKSISVKTDISSKEKSDTDIN